MIFLASCDTAILHEQYPKRFITCSSRLSFPLPLILVVLFLMIGPAGYPPCRIALKEACLGMLGVLLMMRLRKETRCTAVSVARSPRDRCFCPKSETIWWQLRSCAWGRRKPQTRCGKYICYCLFSGKSIMKGQDLLVQQALFLPNLTNDFSNKLHANACGVYLGTCAHQRLGQGCCTVHLEERSGAG